MHFIHSQKDDPCDSFLKWLQNRQKKLRNCFVVRTKPLERRNLKWQLTQFEPIFIVSKIFQVLQTLVHLRRQSPKYYMREFFM